MKQTFDVNLARRIIANSDLPCVGKAGIREINELARQIEIACKLKGYHLELGNPGLPASEIGVRAQIAALKNGIANTYPNLGGANCLKEESSRFIKGHLDLDVDPKNCFATTGSMQGTFASLMLLGQTNPRKKYVLFFTPGFSIQLRQCRSLKIPYKTFHIGSQLTSLQKFHDDLDAMLQTEDIHSLVYSNPNNPTWRCLNDEELSIIGELAKKHDVVVFEDLAYIGMDLRNKLGGPGRPPFVPTVGKFTDKYIIFLSSSKGFSYAGERCGITGLGPALAEHNYPGIYEIYGVKTFSKSFETAMSVLSSGTSHSAQCGVAAILKAVNDGKYNYIDDISLYARKTRSLKDIFINCGFEIAYGIDRYGLIGDGFYFTLKRKGVTGYELVKKFLENGIATVWGGNFGCKEECIRICSSHFDEADLPDFGERLRSISWE